MKKIVSAVLLVIGLLLIWVGYHEYQSLQTNTRFILGSVSSDMVTWICIIGAASAIAGFTGLLRPRETI